MYLLITTQELWILIYYQSVDSEQIAKLDSNRIVTKLSLCWEQNLTLLLRNVYMQ